MAKRSIKDLKSEFSKLRCVTPWEQIEVDKIYHIPPLVSLERRDIMIISKSGNEATYRKLGEKDERKMHSSSVFARFIVRRKKF